MRVRFDPDQCSSKAEQEQSFGMLERVTMADRDAQWLLDWQVLFIMVKLPKRTFGGLTNLQEEVVKPLNEKQSASGNPSFFSIRRPKAPNYVKIM